MMKLAALILCVVATTAVAVDNPVAESAPDMQGAESGYISIIKPGFSAGIGVGPVYPVAYPAPYPAYPVAYPGAYAYTGTYNPYYGTG